MSKSYLAILGDCPRSQFYQASIQLSVCGTRKTKCIVRNQFNRRNCMIEYWFVGDSTLWNHRWYRNTIDARNCICYGKHHHSIQIQYASLHTSTISRDYHYRYNNHSISMMDIYLSIHTKHNTILHIRKHSKYRDTMIILQLLT